MPMLRGLEKCGRSDGLAVGMTVTISLLPLTYYYFKRLGFASQCVLYTGSL